MRYVLTSALGLGLLASVACGGGYSSSSSGPGAGTILSNGIRVRATSGATQSAAAGAAFATALGATVEDVRMVSDGYGGSTQVVTPVPGAAVVFTIVTGAGGATGSFPGPAATATVTADSSGVATAPALTAGTIAGAFTATAAATGAATPATFTLTVN